MKWKRDYGLFTRQMITWLIMGLMYVVLFSVIGWWLARIGMFGSFYLYQIIGMAAMMALIQYFLSDKLVLMSTKAKIVSEDEEPRLYAMVKKLTNEADLLMPRVAIMQSSVPNAFATGRSQKHAIVAVTQTLRNILTDEELEAVLAHELAHVKNRDMLTMTIGSFLVSVAAMIINNASIMALISNNRDNENNGGIIVFIIAMIVVISVYILGTLVTMAISRYREFAADRGSAYITRDPDALIRALKKISSRMDTISPDKKREVSANNAFYIIPTISGKSMMELISTHPTLEKRIENLEMTKREIQRY
ncbi:MAG: zinc metalloprotease HtpX [Methanocalculaceae archaeon]|jgi:heat shock protein HtpX|nr:zinc metalloprotease HtpX [Methanocalculaceae archaeon]